MPFRADVLFSVVRGRELVSAVMTMLATFIFQGVPDTVADWVEVPRRR